MLNPPVSAAHRLQIASGRPHGRRVVRLRRSRPDRGHTLAADEYIAQLAFSAGSRIDSLGFEFDRGKIYGSSGGCGGTKQTYEDTTGEKLGCFSGRAGKAIDFPLFASTGLR